MWPSPKAIMIMQAINRMDEACRRINLMSTKTTLAQNVHPGKPTRYKIMVEGLISENWSERLGGMKIVIHSRANQKPMTVLSGLLQDQSALFGVLNSLHELHMPVIKVNQINYE